MSIEIPPKDPIYLTQSDLINFLKHNLKIKIKVDRGQGDYNDFIYAQVLLGEEVITQDTSYI